MTLATVVLLLSAAFVPAAPDTGPVRALLDTQLAAWNRGDLEAFMETYYSSSGE